jgi:peptidoglycan-associated lipoprotein
MMALTITGCARRQPPVARPVPPATATPPAVTAAPPAPRPTERIDDPLPIAAEPLSEDSIANRSLDDLNRQSPLEPAFFGLDSADLDGQGRAIVSANAALLKEFPTWMILIEGHCDERGTAEYNLALGERRAAAVMTYLVSLGVSPSRLRSVSYGKEFPFDPGHDDNAWAKNRRAQFVITAR